MVSAQWHLNPSTQRQSSAYPSTQRQSWASPLWEVGDILYDGPLWLGSPGWGHWGPLAPQKWSRCPYRSPQWPCPSQCSWHSLLPQWAPPLLPAVRGPWVPQEHPLVTGLPASRSLLPGSLEVVWLAARLPVSLLAMWALTLCFELVPLPFCSPALWCQAILSSELLLQGLCLELWEIKGICLVLVTGLEGCVTSLYPGNWFGKCFLLVDFLFGVQEVLRSSGGLTMGAASFLATFMAASSMAE